MRSKLITIIILLLIFSIQLNAQINFANPCYEISIGRGSSFYNNLQSEQFIAFFKIPNFNGNVGKISYEGDLNFEYILENKKTTYLVGFAPMFRYDKKIHNADLILKAGVVILFSAIRHISNAGIYDSNEGFNSHYLILSLII